jgi:hypothetical protein
VKIHVLAAVTAVTLAAPIALANAFETSGLPGPPPPPVVTCTITDADITVTSFAGILGYQLHGPCKVTFPGTNIKPATSNYEGGGSWTASTGAVNETIKGKDAKGQEWEIRGSANCRLDPWMTGLPTAGCNGTIASATPNAPSNIVKNLQVPVTAGILDQGQRNILTGKALKAILAEHQAPVIVKPAEGSQASLPLTLGIQAGPGSPTKNFALEWQANENGSWVTKSLPDQEPASSTIPAAAFGSDSSWRVRARAHQSASAKWSDWRTFKVLPLPAPPPPQCANTSAYGATYDVSAMPSTLKAGSTTIVTIKVTNMSNQTWGAGSNYRLSYHWAQNGVVVSKPSDGLRTLMPNAVPPCGVVVLQASVKAPAAAGAYQIQWDMLLEGTAWFSAQGVPTGNKPVTVTP